MTQYTVSHENTIQHRNENTSLSLQAIYFTFNSIGDITVRMPNYTAAAYDFIRAFRKGELGKVMLD